MSDALGSHDWTASHDHMPGKPHTLRVDGKVDYPTPGYRAWLEPAEPQGINPRILEMELREVAPGDPQNQVVTPADVHYEDVTVSEYDQVHIRPLGELIDVVHPQ